jgi:hypothetical protein
MNLLSGFMTRNVLSWLSICAALVLSGCSGDYNYTVAGSVSGLSASGLVLQLNGGNDLAVPLAASSFQFPQQITGGDSYDVTIATQPKGLTCTVSNGSGTNDQLSTISNIAVTCSGKSYTLSGTITGLTTAGLVLRNGTELLTVAAHATTFEFPTAIAAGSSYTVVASTQPAGLTCTVSNGAGTKITANVTGILVTCSPSAVTLGGTITGLNAAGLVLQDNGADNLTIAANATTFRFPTPVAVGSAYAVTVFAQPTGQTCSVADGSSTATTDVTDIAVTCVAIAKFTLTVSSGPNGSIAPTGSVQVNSGASQNFVATPSANYGIYQWMLDGSVVQSGGDLYTLSNVVANHTVRVTFATTTLTPSVAALTLAVNNTGLNAALTGTAREVVISNTGSIPATNLAISYPTWPSGTTASSTCTTTLAPAATCTITVTPGATATSTCTSGIAPTAGVVSISSDESNSTLVSVTVVGYGCIYQGGYVFAVDDTTANTGSIGGKVAALADQASGVEWSPDLFNIPGIYDNSSSPCDGGTDGACDTTQIVAQYSADPPSTYAAGACLTTIDGYSDWYLPAICEMSFSAGNNAGCGSAGSPLIQNMNSSLGAAALGASGGFYWTATEFSPNPTNGAWGQFLGTSFSEQVPLLKDANPSAVRCARALTN